MSEDWAGSELPLGRSIFPQLEREEVSDVVAFARGTLKGLRRAERRKLLCDLDGLLNAFAPEIARIRQCVRSGPCLHYVWQPVAGGPAHQECDVDVLGCSELLRHPPFVRLLRVICRDAKRAFHIAVSLIALRDFGNRDYWSVLKARRFFDSRSLRLLLSDARAYKNRRRGAERQGHQKLARRERFKAEVGKMAQRLKSAGEPRNTWLGQIEGSLSRDPDGYPSRRVIQRFLVELGYPRK